MIFETAKFREQFRKDDPTSRSQLAMHLMDIASERVSAKNRNYLTEGKIGQVSKELGILIRKERLSGKGRILFYKNEDGIHLVDYDWNHSSVESLESQSKSSLKRIIGNVNPSPELDDWIQQSCQGPIVSLKIPTGRNRDTYTEELGDEWIRFLDFEQTVVRDDLFKQLQAQDSKSVYLILGGAGTGKTMVLLDLAWKLIHEADIPVQLELPEGVREYLAKSESEYWFQKAKTGSIVLLDDPRDFDSMETAINTAVSQGKRIVISIDPTQWTHKRTRDKFWRFLITKDPVKFELKTAYRQGGAIGQQALKLVSNFYQSASMFADVGKILHDRQKAEYWETLCLRTLTHVDELGFFTVHQVSDEEDFKAKVALEMEGVLAFETYRRWPKLLIGSNDSILLPKGLSQLLSDAKFRFALNYKVRSFRDVNKIRGTEFESVFVFLSKSTFENLNKGPTSLGVVDYERLTQPLTFLTRAENRLAIFVLPNSYPNEVLREPV